MTVFTKQYFTFVTLQYSKLNVDIDRDPLSKTIFSSHDG